MIKKLHEIWTKLKQDAITEQEKNHITAETTEMIKQENVVKGESVISFSMSQVSSTQSS